MSQGPLQRYTFFLNKRYCEQFFGGALVINSLTPHPNSKFAAWKIREHLMNEISVKNFHKRDKLYTFVVIRNN